LADKGTAVLIKSADDKQPDIDALTALLARSDVDAATRKKIEQEIRSIRAGVEGEREAAYEIDFHYRDSKKLVVIHDLRIEVGGRVAQIDHLMINRLLEVWVCETKHFVEGVGVNEYSEWVRFWNGKPHGIPSPVEQNRRHIAVLNDAFKKGLVQLPKRLGVTLKPQMRSYILVSNGARISRPKSRAAAARVDGLDTVIKVDQLKTSIDQRVDQMSGVDVIGSLAHIVSPEAMQKLARDLVALHKPIHVDWVAKFCPSGTPAVAAPEPAATAASPVVAPVPPSSSSQAPKPGPRGEPDEKVNSVRLADLTSTDRLLEDLNPSQRVAVMAPSGPLAIIAGAGSGKTRVISRRAAYAIETGIVPADQILLVTFTDKAAGEMVARMRDLGHPGVMARTFHAAALAQLRHFWPSRHDGALLPAILDSKIRLLVPLIGRLPGGYRFTPAKDIADAIEWAKVRRIRPEGWVRDGGDRVSVPADLFAPLYRDYERAKANAGLIDFEDMLVETVELLEADPEATALVRSRKRWFSVDEYQDTNPLAERLLELWLGESPDLGVVGDPDQTIYTFTGATPDYLLHFAERHPGARVVTLADNYRSSPQILELANRLTAGGPRGVLRAIQPPGPPPTVRRYRDARTEMAAMVEWIGAAGAAGVAGPETAVLVRINAQIPPIEDALTRAGIAFTVRGQRFFERREVREALRLLRRTRPAETGEALVGALERLFVEKLGLDDVAADAGAEGRERAASLELLLGIIEDLAATDPGLTMDVALAELDRRSAMEANAPAEGVNLLTYHRAKGLEWDAVYLPALDEGLLPIRHAKEAEDVAEERRLLYVGITRARRLLALSSSSRHPSRFLSAFGPPRPTAGRVRVLPGPAVQTAASASDDGLLEALRRWRRERAQADAVPAYVVAHDTTLTDIADARPRSLPALRRVRGMGPAKLEKYGSEILLVIGRNA
jgi:DNA helicase-2/ATP-dependent DNA helicase PcrA